MTDAHLPRFSGRARRRFVLIAACLASGCWGGNDATPQAAPQPFAGAKLKVAVPPGSKFGERWQSLLIEWAARTGAEPEVVELAVDGGEAPPAADLLVFPIAALPDLAAAGRLASIPLTLFDENGLRWNDVARGVAATVVSIDRRPVAVPVACPVLVLYYRKDLLARAGLHPPQTWDDYQKLLDTLDRWAPGLSAAEPWSEADRATMFLARGVSLARHPENFSFLFDIEKGAPLIESPAWEKALDDARAALARMPADVLDCSPADCRRLLLEGKAALAVAYDTPRTDAVGAAAAPKPGGGRAEGIQVGVVRLPGSRGVFNRTTEKWEAASTGLNRVDVAGFAGLALGVSKASDDLAAQAAWNLISTLCEPATLATSFPGPSRSLCRMSQADEGEPWHGAELTAGEGAAFLAATAEALNDSHLVCEYPVVGGRRFRAALTEGLASALRGETTSREALHGVQKQWTAIVEEIGPDRVRDGCRRQLGLAPR